MRARWFEVHGLLQLSVSSDLCVPTLSMSQNKFTAAPLPTPNSRPFSPVWLRLPWPSKSPSQEHGKGPGAYHTTDHSHQPQNLPTLRPGAAAMFTKEPAGLPLSVSLPIFPLTDIAATHDAREPPFSSAGSLPVKRGLAAIYSHQWPPRPRGPTEWSWGY